MLRRRIEISALLILIGFILPIQQACAVDPDPESVLHARGLTASGWVYVHQSEADFHSSVDRARSLYREWTTARGRLIESKRAVEMVQMLSAQSEALAQDVALLRGRITGGGFGGRFAAHYHHMQNMAILFEINQAQAYLDLMNRQVAQLKKNLPKPQDEKAAEDEAATRREAVRDAVADLARSAAEIKRRYHDLHGAKEVVRALESLNAAGSAKFRLGPSRAHKADLRAAQALKREISADAAAFAIPTNSGSWQVPSGAPVPGR